jgi:uncharacterized Zn finger protein
MLLQEINTSMPQSTPHNLSAREIRRLAGERFFARGQKYFDEGRVHGLTEYRGQVVAKVAGTEDYRIKLWAERGRLGYSCSCPVGDDGEFCKHCVAVALAWIEESGGKGKKKSTKKSAATMEDVRAFLEEQDKGKLVEMLLNEALESDSLRERLFLETARMNPGQIDLATYRRAIKNATGANDYVDYYSAGAYARGVHRVIESVAALLDEDHAAEVLELTEYALSQIEKSVGCIDDSDGHMGGCVHELQELHHRACLEEKPDVVVLARRLFEWEMHSEWEFFGGAVVTYANVLGETGLAEYRRLAEVEWSKVPALGPGENDSESYGRRFRITSLMEALARQSGDVEALIEIKRRNLSHPYAYLQIAEIYREAGRSDNALNWAEQGWKAFSTKKDWRLGEFLAGEYHRRGCHEEALRLAWEQFTESPRLENYQKLQAHARKAGRSSWPQWRERALAHIRESIAGRKKQKGRQKTYWHWQEADHSELVRVFLWEKRYDEAWQEALAGGCANELWMKLAALREQEHPQDALSIYRERIAPLVEMTNNDAYEQAVELLRKIRKTLDRLGREAEFDDYLLALRVEFKRKRNFIKLLDAIR